MTTRTLNPSAVESIFHACLFTLDELAERNGFLGDAIMVTTTKAYCFHPDRIKHHIPHLKAMVAELSYGFRTEYGPRPAAYLCKNMHGEEWGPASAVDAFLALLLAAKLCRFVAVSANILPETEKYVVFSEEEFKSRAQYPLGIQGATGVQG
jgi:hypothetical protein